MSDEGKKMTWAEKVLPIVYDALKPLETFDGTQLELTVRNLVLDIVRYMHDRPKEYSPRINFKISEHFMLRNKPKEVKEAAITKLFSDGILLSKEKKNMCSYNRNSMEKVLGGRKAFL